MTQSYCCYYLSIVITFYIEGCKMKLLNYLVPTLLGCSLILTGCNNDGSSSASINNGSSSTIANVYIPVRFNLTNGLSPQESLVKTNGISAAGTELVYSPTAAGDHQIFINNLISLGDFIYFEETDLDESVLFQLGFPSKKYIQLDTISNNANTQSYLANNFVLGNIFGFYVDDKMFAFRYVYTNTAYIEVELIEYDDLGNATDHSNIMSGYQLNIAAPIVVGNNIYFVGDTNQTGFIEFDTINLTATHVAMTGEAVSSFSLIGDILYLSTDLKNLYTYDTTNSILNTVPIQTATSMVQNVIANIPENNGYLFSSDEANLIAFNTNTNVATTLDACVSSSLLYHNGNDTYLTCTVSASQVIQIVKVDVSTSLPISTLYNGGYITISNIDKHAVVNNELYFYGADYDATNLTYSQYGLWFLGLGATSPVAVSFSNTSDVISNISHITEMNNEIIFSAYNQTISESHVYKYAPSTQELTELY